MDDKTKNIWYEFNNELYNYIKSKVKNKYDAEDILQDIFIKIYNNIKDLDDQSRIKHWIYKITKNTIIDYYRKKKDILVEIEKIENGFQEVHDSENMNDQISKCLEKLIFELPKKYQDAVKLFEIEGMKHKEISKKLDITISCSKMRVQRAKEKLRNILLDCCYFEVDTYGNIIDYKQKKIDSKRCNYKCE